MARRGGQVRLTKSGRPDARTKAGKLFYRRSQAAKKGWKTRRERQREEKAGWEDPDEGEEVIEEAIETVGGRRYRAKK
jgi:antitoxin (DNA-binding transcriptional repressor) of toxin-antitoxin stability system